MKTLTDLLNELIDTHEITGAFDNEGALMDVYMSAKAERGVTAWYMAQGELLGEATAGQEMTLAANIYGPEEHQLGINIFYLCRKQALEWLKNSDAWRNAETELQQRFDTRPESTFREDTFRALDPTR